MLKNISWLNEPRDWSLEDGVLHAVTELRTDFWRETFYGWTTDSGLFFYQPTTGDFAAEVIVSATHTTRFDQAGMMIRADERNWLKAGLEVTSSTGIMADDNRQEVGPHAMTHWAPAISDLPASPAATTPPTHLPAVGVDVEKFLGFWHR